MLETYMQCKDVDAYHDRCNSADLLGGWIAETADFDKSSHRFQP